MQQRSDYHQSFDTECWTKTWHNKSEFSEKLSFFWLIVNRHESVAQCYSLIRVGESESWQFCVNEILFFWCDYSYTLWLHFLILPRTLLSYEASTAFWCHLFMSSCAWTFIWKANHTILQSFYLIVNLWFLLSLRLIDLIAYPNYQSLAMHYNYFYLQVQAVFLMNGSGNSLVK